MIVPTIGVKFSMSGGSARGLALQASPAKVLRTERRFAPPTTAPVKFCVADVTRAQTDLPKRDTPAAPVRDLCHDPRQHPTRSLRHCWNSRSSHSSMSSVVANSSSAPWAPSRRRRRR